MSPGGPLRASGQFRVFRCGMAGAEAVQAETRHAFPRHTHEQFGIGVIARGAQRSRSGRGLVEAGPGDVITVNPGEVHDGAPLGEGARSWTTLYLEPPLVAELLRDVSAGGATSRVRRFEFWRPVITDAAVAGRLRQLLRAMTGDETADGSGDASIRTEEHVLALLAAVLRTQEQTQERLVARAPGGDAIRAARRRIDDDPAAPVTLADLARESGLSRFQVLRAFTRATGLTPHAYLVQRRIQLARRLIARSVPLADAAAASGFSDQSHMTRVFVRCYGVSPGAYAAAIA